MKKQIQTEFVDVVDELQRKAECFDDLLAALEEAHNQLVTHQATHKERWSNERVNMTSAAVLMADRAIKKARQS